MHVSEADLSLSEMQEVSNRRGTTVTLAKISKNLENVELVELFSVGVYHFSGPWHILDCYQIFVLLIQFL